MTAPKKPLHERILDAELFASKALAEANRLTELGRHERANNLYEKAQYWHDRWVKLSGNGDKSGPKD